jgi:hypothetical protein
MKSVAYSSLAAFLAHFRALQSAVSRSFGEDQSFAEMSAAIATLTLEDRAALDSSAAAGSGRRNRERAELHLKRELTARAILSG